MLHLEFNPELVEIKAISELEKGDRILNLGEVLEIERSAETYSVIVYRMNQKQVFKFETDMILYLNK